MMDRKWSAEDREERCIKKRNLNKSGQPKENKKTENYFKGKRSVDLLFHNLYIYFDNTVDKLQ